MIRSLTRDEINLAYLSMFLQEIAKREKILVKATKEYSVTENAVKEMINEFKNNMWKVGFPLIFCRFSHIIRLYLTYHHHHQSSSSIIIINHHHQSSSSIIIINHHHQSSIINHHHQSSSIIIKLYLIRRLLLSKHFI